MPECPPWAPRPFARSCVRAGARSPLVPRSTRERAKCPASTAERRRHFARSCGAGENRAAGGVEGDRLEAQDGLPGSPRASRRSLCGARGSRSERAGETSVSVHGVAVAFRPLGWRRAGGAATAARPQSASGQNIRVRPPGGRGISPARGDEAGAADVEGDRLEARGGLPGSPRASRQPPIPRAARVPDERAECPGASAGRPRHFARSRNGRARVGERSGTYGTNAGRE
jgi:hypothetical protein